MANNPALQAKTNFPSHRALKPKKRMSRYKEEPDHVQTILHREITNKKREDSEAWAMVFKNENRELAGKIIYKYRLFHLAKKPHRQDVQSIVQYSLFHSALTWDGSKGVKFSTHAVKRAKECMYWVFNLESPIWVNHEYWRLSLAFLKKKAENPEFTMGQFAKEKKFGQRKAKSLRDAIVAVGSKVKRVDILSIYGEGGMRSEDASPGGTRPDSARMDTGLQNGLGTQNMLNANLVQEAFSRVREIIEEVLEPKTARAVLLSSGIGREEAMSSREVGQELGICRSSAHKLYARGRKTLRESRYGAELKEHMETLMRHF